MTRIFYKLIIVFLCFLSSIVHANVENYACMHLLITIKNNTHHTCYLLQDDLKEAVIYPPNDLPFKIPPGQTSTLLDLMHHNLINDIILDLQYECGESKYITLHARKNMCSNQNITGASILNAKDLKADKKTQIADYWADQSASIDWVIHY